MATIIRLKNAEFSAGLPSIYPFVAMESAQFAFDFRNRLNRFDDLTGNHTLTIYRNDIANGQVHVQDDSVIDDLDGVGVSPVLGFMSVDYPVKPIPIKGGEQFSLLLVGGLHPTYEWNDANNAGSRASLSSLFDYGTGINTAGFSAEIEVGTGYAGARIKSGVFRIGYSAEPRRALVQVLTFDGAVFTLHNLTTGQSTSFDAEKSAEIGAALDVVTTYTSNVALGHYHKTSTLVAFPAAFYQVARWNKVLSASELKEQYARSKQSFPTLVL
ncbi:hypothetical protein [Grimontia hollisae]|uniref:hypothetical protein n=1 Tax=Grimontia hollisae TaxID=673 RepID=UPI000DFB51F3|nr:hypothetical protein [Grimontia hollisae]STQ75544.1 Uncharacterised protein [Grimontia hollisae]